MGVDNAGVACRVVIVNTRVVAYTITNSTVLYTLFTRADQFTTRRTLFWGKGRRRFGEKRENIFKA